MFVTCVFPWFLFQGFPWFSVLLRRSDYCHGVSAVTVRAGQQPLAGLVALVPSLTGGAGLAIEAAMWLMSAYISKIVNAPKS